MGYSAHTYILQHTHMDIITMYISHTYKHTHIVARTAVTQTKKEDYAAILALSMSISLTVLTILHCLSCSTLLNNAHHPLTVVDSVFLCLDQDTGSFLLEC